MVLGYYSCSCHPFNSFQERDFYSRQKLRLGQKVKNRCKGISGEIIRILPERGFVIVRYGQLQSDCHLEHCEQLIQEQ